MKATTTIKNYVKTLHKDRQKKLCYFTISRFIETVTTILLINFKNRHSRSNSHSQPSLRFQKSDTENRLGLTIKFSFQTLRRRPTTAHGEATALEVAASVMLRFARKCIHFCPLQYADMLRIN